MLYSTVFANGKVKCEANYMVQDLGGVKGKCAQICTLQEFYTGVLYSTVFASSKVKCDANYMLHVPDGVKGEGAQICTLQEFYMGVLYFTVFARSKEANNMVQDLTLARHTKNDP